MSKKLKPRDKITQKMSRDGLIEVNETAGTAELVSGREQDADFSKKPEQAAQEAAQQLPHPSGSAAARPHTPELSPKRDDAAAERVLEHIDAAHTRTASKKAIKRAQREAAAKTKTSRLQFTEEERATPELQKAICKSERAADRLDEARAAIPKKKVLTKERTFDEAAGKGKTRLRFEEKEKPIFNLQYKLTVTEEIEVRYRTEQRTGSYTDAEGNTHTYTYTVEVPYNYYILNVTLTNKSISSFVSELLTPEQLEMYRVYLQTSGNKPLVFGGGSADTSASEDLSGVQFVNGTRPGNTALVDIAKSQVGNVGGAPYWSWYGFNSRVAWCACFVSWCYGQAGLSEPRFAGCQSQGVPWFTSHGQWGARGYENIAPGDAIFFDWDLDGSADHVGIVIGTDGSRVYTVEGNSGDACKIKSYALTYECIKGYGLMNWD